MAVIIAKSTDTGSTLPVAAGVHWDVYASDAVDSFSIAAGADAIFNVSKGDDKYTLAGSPSDYTVKRSGSFSTDMVFTHIATGKSVTVFVNNEADTLNFGNGATAPIALVNGAVVLGSGTPKAQTVTTTAAAITGFSGGTDTATYTLAVTPGTSITEGQTAVFTITADKALTTDTDLSYSIIGDTLNSTATAATGADYAPSSGTIKILAGQTTASVSVLINSDAAVEGAEGMKFNLMNPANFAVYASQLVMILDDSSVGQTYTLTTARDVRAGTNGDDIFDGSLSGGAQTLNSFDELDGGLGANSLYATIISSVSPAKMANMQNVYITNTGANSVVGLQSAPETTHIYSTSSTASTIFSAIPAVTTNLSISGMADGTDDITFNYASTTGSQTVSLALENVNEPGNVNITDVLVDGIEILNISSGSGSTLTNTIELDDNDLNTLNASGAAPLSITGKGDTTKVTMVDGSAMTGPFTVTLPAQGGVATTTVITVTGGIGNDTLNVQAVTQKVSITGGTGDDTIRRDTATNLTVNDTIDGGDGTDALRANFGDVDNLTAADAFSKITNIETLRLSGASTGAFTLSRVASSIKTLQFDADTAAAGATVVGGDGYDLTVKVGSGSTDAGTNLGGALTVSNAGTGTADIANLVVNAPALNVLAGMDLTSTGYETLVINTSGHGAATQQTIGTIVVTGTPGATNAETVKFTGTNAVQITAGDVITADIIDASGLSSPAAITFDMDAAGGATTITGSGGADDLYGSATLASSIAGGAGNDTIAGGTGNDVLKGEDGNDAITIGIGNDNVDGGAGNDVVTLAAGDVTANDTIVGGDGTDVLNWGTYTAATDDLIAAQARISGFETFRVIATAATQSAVMSNYINNPGFTLIEVGTHAATARGVDFTNVGSTLNNVNAIGAVAGTYSFDRLADSSTDALTISNATVAGAASTFTAFTALDEETLTLTSTLTANNLTFTDLTVGDLKTLNITGSSAVVITNAIGGTFALSTVNASTATGAVTVNASASNAAVTMTANPTSSAVNTFTGSALTDSITGGAGADVLAGGIGKDTISGGLGGDNITGGAGADSMTGGAGVDTFVGNLTSSVAASATTFAGATLAAGDTLTFANGVDVITDFTAGATGDVFENGAAVVNAIASGIGQNVTTGFATATTTYYVSGSYASGGFTATANGTGADTMIILGDAGPTALNAHENIVILVGVNTADLVAANFS